MHFSWTRGELLDCWILSLPNRSSSAYRKNDETAEANKQRLAPNHRGVGGGVESRARKKAGPLTHPIVFSV